MSSLGPDGKERQPATWGDPKRLYDLQGPAKSGAIGPEAVSASTRTAHNFFELAAVAAEALRIQDEFEASMQKVREICGAE